MRCKALCQAVLAVICIAALPAMAVAQDGVEAAWVHRQVSFVYQGFTTHYSCDGLRETIRRMLAKLGARDLKVRSRACTRMVGAEPFPGVRVTMQVLVPASSEEGGKAAGPKVAAHWQKVVLLGRNSGIQEQGKCELIEQFKETFLPLFSTRHISYRSNCIPHQLTLGTHLSAEVLMPDVKPSPRH